MAPLRVLSALKVYRVVENITSFYRRTTLPGRDVQPASLSTRGTSTAAMSLFLVRCQPRNVIGRESCVCVCVCVCVQVALPDVSFICELPVPRSFGCIATSTLNLNV